MSISSTGSQPVTFTLSTNAVPTTFVDGATRNTFGGFGGGGGPWPLPQANSTITVAIALPAVRMSLLQNEELHAAIQLSAPRGQVRRHRLGVPIACRLDAAAVNSLCDKVVSHRAGAVLRQLLVEL